MSKYFPLLFLMILFPANTVVKCQPVTDADGNVYTAVKIGKLIWLSENLKTTKLNDGKPIANLKDIKAWRDTQSPAFCWLNNNIQFRDEYGALYNWYAVNTKKLCPVGWHVPSKDEWLELELLLGDRSKAGSKLKEAGLEHWKNPYNEASNDFGFTALPAGGRKPIEDFEDSEGVYSIWWSSTEFTKDLAWNRGLFVYSDMFYGSNGSKKNGFSVRCVKD